MRGWSDVRGRSDMKGRSDVMGWSDIGGQSDMRRHEGIGDQAIGTSSCQSLIHRLLIIAKNINFWVQKVAEIVVK